MVTVAVFAFMAHVIDDGLGGLRMCCARGGV